MNIIILGAGAIGSLYGAKLSKLNDVILIGKKQHTDKINKDGLIIKGIENEKYKLKAETEIKKINQNTLILLTTKVYDSENAIRKIEDMIKKDTVILCLQNGLYSEKIVKDIVKDKCTVLRGITNFGAVFLEPGVVQYNSYGYTAIETNKKENKKGREIAENFKKCGLNGYVSDNIKYDVWKKLILNCVLNPLTAIMKVENKFISEENLNPIKEIIIQECLEAAKKDGVKFDIDFVKLINDVFRDSNNISSMRQDIIKGRKTEIDCLNGAVAELGKKHGIMCPFNEGLVMMIKCLEKTQNI